MTRFSHLIQFVLAALIVIIIGGLLGWYYFVHRQIQSTESVSSARGGVAPSFGNPTGSVNQNASGFSSDGASASTATSSAKGAPRLWHVTKNPVAGFSFGTGPDLAFVEVSSGNILSADPTSGGVTRLTNTLYPKTYDAVLAQNGDAVLRFVDGGVTKAFAGTLATTTESIDSTSTPETLQGLYLPQGIKRVAVMPPHAIIYVQESSSGSTIVTSDWKGANQKKLFTSAISGWRLYPLNDGTLIIAQDPSDGVAGSAYSLSKTGSLSPILRSLPGLTIVPREGGAKLYALSNGTLELYGQTDAAASPVKLPIKTSADKCVWAPGKDLIAYCAAPAKVYSLDAHAQGAVHTSDTWYKVDVSAGTAEQLFSTDSSLSLDVEKPTIDASGSYLAFDNAIDRSLWTLRIAP